MNLYVVVEGKRTEPKLFRKWLPHMLPGVREVQRTKDSDGGTFLLVSGQGYPAYKDIVAAAVRDCARSSQPFHLVVCVDAEEVPVADRASEIRAVIDKALQSASAVVPHTVVVADCCIETWLLGNRKLVRRNPEDEELLKYQRHYDVINDDPELMPQRAGDRNRATTHLSYLKAAFRERGLTYTKNHPGDAGEPYYFDALAERATKQQADGSHHLRSFAGFLEVGKLANAKTANE